MTFKTLLKYFIFLVLFLLTQCSKYEYTNYKKLKEPDKVAKLHSEVVTKLESYSRFEVINDYLILAGESISEKLIKIIDLKSNVLLKSFGSKGQGPEEFISTAQIIRDPKEQNSFWIYDLTARNLKKFNIEKILNDNFSPEEIIRISGENGLPNKLTFSSDGKILGVGLFLKGRISFYDLKGNFIKSIGKIPVKLRKGQFTAQHSHGFIGDFIFKESSKEIFVATRHGSIVERYDINGNLIRTYIGPEPFYPDYDIVPAFGSFTMTYTKRTRFGYIDICYDQKHDRIFLLYSGRYQYNKENLEPNCSNTIYVLDNKDRIQEKIELDKEIYDIALSNDGSTIFGASETELLKLEYKAKNMGRRFDEKTYKEGVK